MDNKRKLESVTDSSTKKPKKDEKSETELTQRSDCNDDQSEGKYDATTEEEPTEAMIAEQRKKNSDLQKELAAALDEKDSLFVEYYILKLMLKLEEKKFQLREQDETREREELKGLLQEKEQLEEALRRIDAERHPLLNQYVTCSGRRALSQPDEKLIPISGSELDIGKDPEISSLGNLDYRKEIFAKIKKMIDIEYEGKGQEVLEKIDKNAQTEILPNIGKENQEIIDVNMESILKRIESSFIYYSAWGCLQEIKKILVRQLKPNKLEYLKKVWVLLTWAKHVWKFIVFEENVKSIFSHRDKNVWVEGLREWSEVLIRIEKTDYDVLEMEVMMREISLSLFEIIVTAGYLSTEKGTDEKLVAILKDTVTREQHCSYDNLKRCLNIGSFHAEVNLARSLGQSVQRYFEADHEELKKTTLFLHICYVLENMISNTQPRRFSHVAGESSILNYHSCWKEMISPFFMMFVQVVNWWKEALIDDLSVRAGIRIMHFVQSSIQDINKEFGTDVANCFSMLLSQLTELDMY